MPGPILIFDSGVGGLSVTAALRARLPTATLDYVCDNAMLPYGTKADAWLVSRIVATCTSAVRASGAAGLVVEGRGRCRSIERRGGGCDPVGLCSEMVH